MNINISDDELKDQLLNNLPPAFGRKKIDALLPGVVSAKTLANLKSEDSGPPYRKMGKDIIYIRESFVEWLVNRK